MVKESTAMSVQYVLYNVVNILSVYYVYWTVHHCDS